MTSMLAKCPQCGVTHAKDLMCPECGWSDRGDDGIEQEQLALQTFADRLRVHRRNYSIYMALMFGTGLFGLISGYMWLRLIFMGDVIALIIIGFCTVVTFVLTGLLFCSEKFLPTNLNCPTCEIELDTLGFEGDRCPGCSSRLR